MNSNESILTILDAKTLLLRQLLGEEEMITPHRTPEAQAALERQQQIEQAYKDKEEEEVKRVIPILQDWFNARKDGSANRRYPSLDCPITQAEADKQIKALDKWSEDEYEENTWYHLNNYQTHNPWNYFNYLEPHARRAMVEELWKAEGITQGGE